MAEKKEYPRKMPLAPVDDAAPSKPRMGPKPTPKTPKTPPTSDELERRYDKLRQKDLNDASMTGKPTGYKKGGSVSSASKRADGCAVKGKTRGKVC
jgi:hypothetical protein